MFGNNRLLREVVKVGQDYGELRTSDAGIWLSVIWNNEKVLKMTQYSRRFKERMITEK